MSTNNIIFPASPINGQVFIADNDITYIFDAASGVWEAQYGTSQSVSSADIIDGEVKTADIFNGAVTLTKLGLDVMAELSSFVKIDGSTSYTANHDAGGYKMTNLAPGTLNGDAVRMDQLNLVQGQVSAILLRVANLELVVDGGFAAG